jgi:hypothetical protein
MAMVPTNEPYRLELKNDRDSQAFDLGCRNGPYRPEIRMQLFTASQSRRSTIFKLEEDSIFLAPASIPARGFA